MSGESPFGCLDMVGNVWQWCLDRYSPITSDEIAKNPVASDVGQSRVLRGGSWCISDRAMLTAVRRSFYRPEGQDDDNGFRLVCPVERER